MLQLKTLDRYTIDDMKVFEIDGRYIASPTLLHALAYVDEHVQEINVPTLKATKEMDIDKTELLRNVNREDLYDYPRFLAGFYETSWKNRTLREIIQRKDVVGVYVIPRTIMWV